MKTKGFTLVELAIVMTIIGLLIGGILKGQELLENARVTSTIAQVKSYDAAVTAFRDIYEGLPGDLKDAGNRIPGCNEGCTPSADGAGNGIVENAIAYGDWFTSYIQNIPPTSAQEETRLFWLHLLKANLISGVSDRQMSSAVSSPTWGEEAPSAKVGGGFYARHYDQSGGTLPYSTKSVRSGLLLMLYPSLNAEFGSEGQFVLAPSRARQIDAKMDDGMPDSGNIYAVNQTSENCVVVNGSSIDYDSSRSTKNCTLVFMLQQ